MTYSCHGIRNKTACVLLVDPVLNRRLRNVLDD